MAKNPEIQFKSDIQSETHQSLQKLDWVGMGHMQSVLQLHEVNIPCALSMTVNLSEGNRGIHMSRLYTLMTEQFLNKKVKDISLKKFLETAIRSQEGLSDEAGLTLNFSYPLQTQALRSGIFGFRNYPVHIAAIESPAGFHFWLQFEILYSSTCPQSAALSLESLKNKLSEPSHDFQMMQRLPATPHAQRSVMTCDLLYSRDIFANLDALIAEQIKNVEQLLKTPVQTAVKKADEIAFAELNAENLMFCEDAVRRIDEALSEVLKKSEVGLTGYKIKTRHEESLHPHNAISCISRNFQPHPFN